MGIIPFYREENWGSKRLNKFGQSHTFGRATVNLSPSASKSHTFLSFLVLSGAFSMFSEDLESFNFLIIKAVLD